MPRPYLIIDGYNLMHAAGFARRKYAPGQLEHCRVQLLRYLASHLGALERERTTIVFDAHDAPTGLPREMSFEGMAVAFASPGKEADDTIEELVAAHSAPRQIRLVSSDHRLQRSARKRRGTFVDSDDFFQELERRGTVSDPAPQTRPLPLDYEGPGPPQERTDTEDWLSVLGEILEINGSGENEASIDAAEIAALQEEIDRETRADSRAARQKPRRNDEGAGSQPQ